MSYIVYINGNKIKVSENSPIAFTKQVNDIANVENRQSNFTHTFIAPKIAENIKALENVSLVGNQSNLPYQKNVCSIFDYETGECMVYNGWAIIKKSTQKGYEIYVYDGNIDLYKAIENDKLSVLDLTELEHSKDTSVVVGTFTNDALPYKYIIADFNGKSIYDTDKINIDYLVPSVKVSWIWNKIFEHYGFTYSGDIFDNPDFTNLWLTYPKPVITSEEPVNMFTITTLTGSGGYVPELIDISPTGISDSVLSVDGTGRIFTALQSETLRITLISNLWVYLSAVRYYVKVYVNIDGVPLYLGNMNHLSGQRNDTFQTKLPVVAGKTYVFYVVPYNFSGDANILTQTTSKFDIGNFTSIQFEKFLAPEITYENVFDELSVRDFMNEIIWRFGLTIFKKKYEQDYVFKTLRERIILSSDNVIDWSSKFIEVVDESYIYGNYAQKNKFLFKYNDENATYDDGSFLLSNKNIQEEKEVVKSKIYAKEKSLSTILGFTSPIYKLWEKEINDNSEVTYKDLANKFYFIKKTTSLSKYTDTWTIGSPTLATSEDVDSFPISETLGMTWQEVLDTYYSSIQNIIDKSLLLTAKINLKKNDVSDIDFSKLYYIDKLASYFILNKVINFQKNGSTLCELVKIKPIVELSVPEDKGFDLDISWTIDASNVYLTIVYPPESMTIPFYLHIDSAVYPMTDLTGTIYITRLLGSISTWHTIYITNGVNTSKIYSINYYI